METIDIWLSPLILLPAAALLLMSTAVRVGHLQSEIHSRRQENAGASLPALYQRFRRFRNALLGLYAASGAFAFAVIVTGLLKLAAPAWMWLVIPITFVGLGAMIFAAVELVRESLTLEATSPAHPLPAETQAEPGQTMFLDLLDPEELADLEERMRPYYGDIVELAKGHGCNVATEDPGRYRCLPESHRTALLDLCLAALSMEQAVFRREKQGSGDPVALRMGVGLDPRDRPPGKIYISQNVHEQVRFFFDCVIVSGDAEEHVYQLRRLRPRYAQDGAGRVPGPSFHEVYEKIQNGYRLRPKRKQAS